MGAKNGRRGRCPRDRDAVFHAKRIRDLSVGGSSPDMHQTCVRKYVLRDSTSPRGAASPKKQRFTPVLIAIYWTGWKGQPCGERITVFAGFSFGSRRMAIAGEVFICTIDFSCFNREIGFINRSIASIVVQIPKFEKNFNVKETRFCYSLLSLLFFVSIEPRRLAGNFISITFGTCMAT